MKAKISKIDKQLPLPAYRPAEAAAFDFYSREEMEIAPREIGYVPLNCVVEIPKNHCMLVFARSSSHKKGLMLINGVGIIDPNFCGPEDEIKAVYYNFSESPVKIDKEERIAQGIIIPIEKINWIEVNDIRKESRGGFGSTGK